MTVHDGVDLRGAAYIAPISHHPNAVAVADALSGALRAAYYYDYHHAQYLGSTTYPIDHRVGDGWSHLASRTAVNVSRVENVYLPAHTTAVQAEAWFVHTPNETRTVISADLQVVGSSTVTSDAVTCEMTEEEAVMSWFGGLLYRVDLQADVTDLTLPDDDVQIQVRALVTARSVVPLLVHHWRVTDPTA